MGPEGRANQGVRPDFVIAPAAAASRLRGHDTYGTEHWENIGNELSSTGFSARAFTNDAASGSREGVLEVISTLSCP